MALIKVLLLLSAIALSSDAFRMQSVAVKGKLMCGSQPAANVQVKLLDEDQGKWTRCGVFLKNRDLLTIRLFCSQIIVRFSVLNIRCYK